MVYLVSRLERRQGLWRLLVELIQADRAPLGIVIVMGFVSV